MKYIAIHLDKRILQRRTLRPNLAAIVLPFLTLLSILTAQGANVLSNPSMEAGLGGGWIQYGRTGQDGWYSFALATVPDPTVTGNNSFKVYAAWNADPNFGGTYQDVACLPTSTFTAEGWFRTKSTDQIQGTYGAGLVPDDGNTCWIEVTFRDAANTVLGLYKSAVFDGSWAADVWFLMPITNQCDIATGLPTNSVTTLTAPAGTTKARYQVVLKQSQWHGAGALWVDDMVLNQISGPVAPALGNISPGSILLANAANGISFTVNSPSSTTINNGAILVTLNGTNVSSGLIITGNATNKNVSYQGLQTNQSYTVGIQVTDTLGLGTSNSFSFDTWSPLFLWEGEDFDFDGGQFIDNPTLSSTVQPTSYLGKTGVPAVDFNESNGEGDHLYRSTDGMATTVSGDTARAKFLTAQMTDPAVNDYKVGWFPAPEWVNYTRTYPTGSFNVHARLAGGAGAATLNLSRVTSGWGTDTQTTTNLGKFSFTGTGWSSFHYVPLTDANGNLATLTLGGTNTLRITTGGGGDVNFLMLTVVNTNRPVITEVYPNGSTLMQGTNTFRFNVSSSVTTINNNSIHLTLNGVDVSSQLVIGGTPSAKTVSYPGLLLNVPNYTAVISVTDANGNSAGTTVVFDTFSASHFTWEAEDYDYDGGKFIDNPAPSAYFELLPLEDIDVNEINGAGGVVYRTADGVGTEVTGDVPRTKFAGTNDYNIGWFVAGEWLNYTRTYPAGSYYVYSRAARGTGTNGAPLLSKVTAGAGTVNQTVVDLGSFSVDSRGWQTYAWQPLRNGSGQLVAVNFDGTPQTLRITSAGPEANTEVNLNAVLLVPAPNAVALSAARSGGNVVLSFQTQLGFSYQVLYKNNLEDGSWVNLGTPVIGDGTIKSVNDPIAGARRFYRLFIQ